MTASAETLASNNPTSQDGRFRVQDSARALWGVMAVLLLSGFGVLRFLTGASEAPVIDRSGNIEATQASPAAELPEDDVHRLRPQTSAALPMLIRTPATSSSATGSSAVGPNEAAPLGSDWNHLPAVHSEPVPMFGESIGIDVAQEPDMRR